MYLVEDGRVGGALVALKTLGALTDPLEGAQELEREFLLLTDLSFPHLASAYDFDRLQNIVGGPPEGVSLEAFALGQPFFTREFVDGVPVLESAAIRSIEGCVRVFLQVVTTVAYLHRQGILHRDLKPDNILISDGGTEGRTPRARIIDFGLAVTTRSAEAAGNARYLAPEVLLGSPLTPKAELYALGLILYEALVGAPPFHGDTAADLARARVELPVPPLPSPVPPALESLVIDVLDGHLETRPGAEDFVRRLEACLPEAGRQIAVSRGSCRLVGRHHEAQAFHQVLEGLMAPQPEKRPPRTLLLTGAPGIGKTRLALALAASAQVLGARYLRASGRLEAEAFSAGRELLRPLIQERPDLLTPEREVLRHLLSGRTFLPAEQPSPDLPPRRAMVRLFDAVLALMEAVAAEQPLLVIMEDLHWADPESLELFAHLQRHATSSRLLLVGTAWPPGESKASIDAFLADMPLAGGQAVWMELEGLVPSEIATFVERSLGLWPVPEPIVEQLTLKTKGNPLFLEEILRLARSADHLSELLFTDHLPGAVGEAFRQQILTLGPDSLTALQGLAVWGSPASSVDLAEVTGQGRRLILAGLEDAVACQLVREKSGTFWFWHAVLAQVLEPMLSPEERAAYHRRAGARREALPGAREPEQLRRLVAHFTIASDRKKALEYAIQGAALAEKQFMSRRAIELYEQARALSTFQDLQLEDDTPAYMLIRSRLANLYALTGRYPDAEEEARGLLADSRVCARPKYHCEVLILLGEVAARRGELESARHSLKKALEVAPTHEASIDVLNRLCDVVLRQGNLEEASALCESAQALLEDRQDARRAAEVAVQRGKIAQQRSDYPVALTHYEEASRRFEEAEFRPGLAAVSNAIAQVYHYQTDYVSARDAMLRALRYLEQLGDVEGVASTLERLALTTFGLRDSDAAIAYGERSLKEWQRLGNAQGAARTLVTVGILHHAIGSYGEGIRCAHEAIDLQRAAGDQAGLLVSYQNLSILYSEIGSQDEALRAALTALELVSGSGSKLRWLRCHHLLGVIYAARGEARLSSSHLRDALALAREVGNNERTSDILCAFVDSDLRANDLLNAREHADEAVALCAGLGRNQVHTQARVVSARVALLETNADLRAELEALEAVFPTSGELSNPDLLWQCWEVRGRILLRLRRPHDAVRSLTRAMDVIQGCWRRLPDRLRPVYVADPRRQSVRNALRQAIIAFQGDSRPKSASRSKTLLEGDSHEPHR